MPLARAGEPQWGPPVALGWVGGQWGEQSSLACCFAPCCAIAPCVLVPAIAVPCHAVPTLLATANRAVPAPRTRRCDARCRPAPGPGYRTAPHPSSGGCKGLERDAAEQPSARHPPASRTNGMSAAGGFRCLGFVLLRPAPGKRALSGNRLIRQVPSERGTHALHIMGKEKRLLTRVHLKNRDRCSLPPPLSDEAPVPHKGFIIAMRYSPPPATSSSARWAALRRGE